MMQEKKECISNAQQFYKIIQQKDDLFSNMGFFLTEGWQGVWSLGSFFNDIL